jgi:hypothetical protein
MLGGTGDTSPHILTSVLEGGLVNFIPWLLHPLERNIRNPMNRKLKG